MKRPYFPESDGAMLPFLQNICAKMGNYLVALQITGADQSFMTLACALWNALTDYQNRARTFAQDWTALRKACFKGSPSAPLPTWPVWTGPAAPPIGLDVGCNKKLRAIIARWKKAPGYTTQIGEDLGIEGAEVNVDPNNVQPELKVELVAGQPRLSAPLQGFDAVEYEVDRGNGFGLLNVSTGAPVLDTHALPAAGESDVWTYRAVLRENNVRVGQWSPPIAVPVMGI